MLFVGPLQFDFDAMFAGGDMLGVEARARHCASPSIARDGTGDVRWIQTDPFWVWHFANAFDRNRRRCRTRSSSTSPEWSRPGFGEAWPDHRLDQPGRARPAGRHVSRSRTSPTSAAEFSRIDDRLIGQPHRHFIATNKTGASRSASRTSCCRVDTTHRVARAWVSGDSVFDEVIFVPAPGGEPEQGFYVTFRTDRTTLKSDFVVLAADDITAGPIARIPLPFRVPAGLHGNWFPSS